MTVKLSTDDIRLIAAFEKLTMVHARDCITTESGIYFLVEPSRVGLAIGKDGKSVKHVSKVLGKPVKVFADAETPEDMVRSLIPKLKSVERSGETITISIAPPDRSLVIGKGGSNINMIKTLLKRHFGILEVRLR